MQSPADDTLGKQADAGRGTGHDFGSAPYLDTAWPPRRQHIVDDQGGTTRTRDVPELLGPGEVPAADLDEGRGRVQRPAERDHVRRSVRSDRGQPSEPVRVAT